MNSLSMEGRRREAEEKMEALGYVLRADGVCVCVCVCVCVFGGAKDQREFENKCEKGKGKEGERRLSASVMNGPSAFVVCVCVCIISFLSPRTSRLQI